MSDYSIKVKNNSGARQKIAIYQVYPNLAGGLPLVWITKNINNENDNTFFWSIDWALNWGTSQQVLAPGVEWESGGTPRLVEPNQAGGNNKVDLGYYDGDFESSNAFNDASIPAGSMDIATDRTFTVTESEKMSVAVYMDGKPTFAMQGRPNGLYQFDTHPTYYLCTTDSKEGVAVSGNFVSSVQEVVFSKGVTDLSYELNDTLDFVKV